MILRLYSSFRWFISMIDFIFLSFFPVANIARFSFHSLMKFFRLHESILYEKKQNFFLIQVRCSAWKHYPFPVFTCLIAFLIPLVLSPPISSNETYYPRRSLKNSPRHFLSCHPVFSARPSLFNHRSSPFLSFIAFFFLREQRIISSLSCELQPSAYNAYPLCRKGRSIPYTPLPLLGEMDIEESRDRHLSPMAAFL